MWNNELPQLIIALATPADIPQVLALQSQYLVTNLSPEARLQGFVTTPFTVAQLTDIIAQSGLWVAKNETDTVIAYLFAGSWAYFSQWAIFNVMTARFPPLTFNHIPITTENSFQYGPICIHETYRGTGLLRHIFEAMRCQMQFKYPLSLTFINTINTRSMTAHINKLQWQIIDEFSYNANNYKILAFDMSKSVLL